MKLSFIGAGNLSEAIIRGLISLENSHASDITIFDISPSQYEKYNDLSVNRTHDLKEAVYDNEIVFLMVKPNNFAQLLSDIKNFDMDLSGKIFVSPAAAISINFMQKHIGQKIAIVRTMPNTSISIGKGMTALCRSDNVSDIDFTKVCEIFKSCGEIIVLPEGRMNDIIAVNGSSPAYVYLFADAMLKGAKELGFDEGEIYSVILQSLSGAFDMLIKSGKTPRELIKAVASPNGTTEKALESFANDGFEDIIVKAMIACANRAEEIARDNK